MNDSMTTVSDQIFSQAIAQTVGEINALVFFMKKCIIQIPMHWILKSFYGKMNMLYTPVKVHIHYVFIPEKL